MDKKQYYTTNWNNYWQSYAKLNPDLANNGITSKRALMNHYMSLGYKENRNVEIITEQISKEFILSENIFKEKI